jgi:hypothetical protein
METGLKLPALAPAEASGDIFGFPRQSSEPWIDSFRFLWKASMLETRLNT